MRDEPREVTTACPRCGAPIVWVLRDRGGGAAAEVLRAGCACALSRDQWADLAEQAEARLGRRGG